MERTEWATVQTSETTYDVLPQHDVIEHRKGFLCPCNPAASHQFDGYGRVWWNFVHNSFDEFLDEDQIEPYKGL